MFFLMGKSDMKILEAHDKNGWITAVIEGRWVCAKVYDETSMYGVNECRVSKLSIGKTNTRDPDSNFFDQMDYNYDRGLDFHNETLSEETLDKILEALNRLPKVMS
jgi:hypothetical protein